MNSSMKSVALALLVSAPAGAQVATPYADSIGGPLVPIANLPPLEPALQTKSWVKRLIRARSDSKYWSVIDGTSTLGSPIATDERVRNLIVNTELVNTNVVIAPPAARPAVRPVSPPGG